MKSTWSQSTITKVVKKAKKVVAAVVAAIATPKPDPFAVPPWHDNGKGTLWRDESAEEELQRKREINERGAAIRAQRASVLAQALGFERDRDPDVSIPGDWLKPPHEKPYRPRR